METARAGNYPDLNEATLYPPTDGVPDRGWCPAAAFRGFGWGDVSRAFGFGRHLTRS